MEQSDKSMTGLGVNEVGSPDKGLKEPLGGVWKSWVRVAPSRLVPVACMTLFGMPRITLHLRTTE